MGHGGSTVRPGRVHQRRAASRGAVAKVAGKRLAGHAGDGTPPAALAPPCLRRRPPVLLPGRSHRDPDLADRGRSRAREGRTPLRRAPGRRERRNDGRHGIRAQPGCGEAGDRRRQDHRHGAVDRVADDQCGAAAGQPAVHARIPRGHARRDHPAAPARPPAERSRQLLRQPRARAGRHAPRPRTGENRHHELPRVPAPRDERSLQGRTGPAPGTGITAADTGDRRPDAAARDARTAGPKTDPGPQRRGAPLLPG